MRFSDLPIDRPVATLMILVCLMVLGTVSAFLLPLDFFPLVAGPKVDIDVTFPGSHPLEALREVELPIEEELATVPGLETIRSWTRGGHVWMEAQFDWSTDIETKKIDVRAAVERARLQLPDDVDHIDVEGEISGPGGGAIIEGRISADRDLSESWDLLDRRIKRPLERIRGVARVDLYGVEPRQIRIDLDLDALARHGVRPAAIISAVDAAAFDLDLGALRGDLLRYDVRSESRIEGVEQIKELRLPGTKLRVGDVANVELREPRLSYGRHLDRNFAIGIGVYREPTANTVATVDRVMERIEEIENDPKLSGVKLLVWENQGEEIRAAITGLRNAGLLGGVLAVLMLYAFLRSARTTLLVATAIPFSLLVTCAGMFLLGKTLNVLSMLGLALGVGMMVDNAVVVIENIHRLEDLEHNPRQAARLGARQVSLAVLAATATTVIVWSWLLVLERSELTIQAGAAALPICLAVVSSLLISLTFIPLVAARFPARENAASGFLADRLNPAYRRLLRWTFRHRPLTLLALLSLAATAIIPFRQIEKVDEPQVVGRYVTITYGVHDPSTKEILEEHVNLVESYLATRKEELGYDSMYSWFDENGGTMTRLYLPPGRISKEMLDGLRARIQPVLPEIAGVSLTLGEEQWWRRRFQGERRVNLSIRGTDPEFLQELAARAEARLRRLEDAIDVFGPSVEGKKELRIHIDPERAHALGVTPESVAGSVNVAFRGRKMRRIDRGDHEVDVVLSLPEEARPGVSSLADLPIQRVAGAPVPLASVASIEIARTPRGVWREDRAATAWVGVQFDKEAVANTEEGRARVSAAMEGFELPQGYSWGWGNMGERLDDTLQTMTNGVLLSLLVVVMLMAALFESFSQPLAIVITLPLAFFGAFWSLWIGGYVLDPVSFFGLILLIGIVVNNGIVMVNHVNNLRREGMDRVDALIQGCADRLRPILMTALTTIFGLVPLALSAFAVGGAPMGPLATAMIGGLATSTLFTLIALPVWYTGVEDVGSVVRRALPRWR